MTPMMGFLTGKSACRALALGGRTLGFIISRFRGCRGAAGRPRSSAHQIDPEAVAIGAVIHDRVFDGVPVRPVGAPSHDEDRRAYGHVEAAGDARIRLL